MEINYSLRSKFTDKCRSVIEAAREDLDHGRPITILFDEGGYDNHTSVTIDQHNRNQFQTDLELNDATRFPARIKAAATALRECECFGRFEIVHENGTLTIRQL